MKGYEHHNHGNKSFSKNLHDIVKSKDENQKSSSFDDLKSQISEKVKSVKNNDCVWPIMRDDDPSCEWTENDEIVGGCFPFLFLSSYNLLLG